MPRSTSLSPKDLRKPRMVSDKPARRRFRAAPKQSRLLDEVGAIDRLGAGREKTKGFLHVCPQCFWKAGCQDSVSRSSAREALSASLPSKA